MPRTKGKHVALLLVEGATEVEFYETLLKAHCARKSKKIRDLKGNFNINSHICDKVRKFLDDNPHDTVDVYVCIDQEKPGGTPYNKAFCEGELRKFSRCKKIESVIADLMIESLFFLDIEGIFEFLNVPKNQRKPTDFQNFRKLRHQDLSRLFKKYGKIYYKGHKCEKFVEALDMKKFIQATEIKNLINSI